MSCPIFLHAIDAPIPGLMLARLKTTALISNICSSAVNWTSNDWCKIRQMVTTSIFPYEGRPTIGSLKVGGRWSGDPAPALVEAKKVDDNWFSSDATKKSRGVEAVKAAIAEWESIVQSGNLAMIGA